VSAPKDNIVHHQVHRDIRVCHGDEREECSLLDVMSSSLVMAPIIRTGRSEKVERQFAPKYWLKEKSFFCQNFCESLRVYMALYPKGSVVHYKHTSKINNSIHQECSLALSNPPLRKAWPV
jgi:hypothetical protein